MRIRLALLGVLMLADYGLTKFGVSEQVITEGNPLLVWLFQIPVWAGVACRLLIIAAVIALLLLIKVRKPAAYPWVLNAGLAVNSMIIAYHFVWIGEYLRITTG